jgi:hypothetical protein
VVAGQVFVGFGDLQAADDGVGAGDGRDDVSGHLFYFVLG